jgi:hypothetical protein
MRICLLILAIALSLQGFCASVGPAGTQFAGTQGATAQLTAMDPSGHHKNPFKERQLYDKGKGTIGLIAGLTLGPIGYVGAHLFSRNRTIRQKAGQGFAVWFCVVGLTVLVVAAVNSKQSGGQLALDFLQGLLQNWN